MWEDAPKPPISGECDLSLRPKWRCIVAIQNYLSLSVCQVLEVIEKSGYLCGLSRGPTGRRWDKNAELASLKVALSKLTVPIFLTLTDSLGERLQEGQEQEGMDSTKNLTPSPASRYTSRTMVSLNHTCGLEHHVVYHITGRKGYRYEYVLKCLFPTPCVFDTQYKRGDVTLFEA